LMKRASSKYLFARSRQVQKNLLRIFVKWDHLLNAVARIQNEAFLWVSHLVLDCNIAFDIDIGHDYAFF
jgi:hypothetical protein